MQLHSRHSGPMLQIGPYLRLPIPFRGVHMMDGRLIPHVIGVSPFETPDVGLVVALVRAGALGVLDLGHDARVAQSALDTLARRLKRPFGVRLPEHLDMEAIDLPKNAAVVVVPASTRRFAWRDRVVLAQAC